MKLFKWIFESWGNIFIAAFVGAFILLGVVIVWNSITSRPHEDFPHFSLPVSAAIPQTPGYLPNAPRSYRNGVHEGIDLDADVGTPVRASRDGKVIEIGSNPALDGDYIVIAHKFGSWFKYETWKTKYSHLGEIKVKNGQKVDKGQVIALSDCTGHCLVPHLHFEIWKPDGTFLGQGYDELELQLLLSKYITK